MKKIVIIGSSPAVVKAIEEIRASDQESQIVLICPEGVLPYNRFVFPEILGGSVTEKQCVCQDESFYKKLNVEIIKDKKVLRMTPKRNKIVLTGKDDEKEDCIYDVLIMTDAETKVPEIKGNQRDGVHGFRRFADAQAISKLVPLADVIIVQSETIWGLEIIESLRKKNKEVIWVNPAKHLFTFLIDAQTAGCLKNNLEAEGIRILTDNAVAEILGDQETKAVRLKNGKVLAADMVIFPESGPDLKIYADGGLTISSKLNVNLNFQTSTENLFALDDIADFEGDLSLATLEEQGKIAAAKITGRPAPSEAAVAPESQSQPA